MGEVVDVEVALDGEVRPGLESKDELLEVDENNLCSQAYSQLSEIMRP